jgi:hypothetical protein
MIDRNSQVTEYRRLRAANLALHNRLVGLVSKPVLQSSAVLLGLLDQDAVDEGDDALIFENEHEIDVLMDYSIYHGRRGPGARTVVEQAAFEAASGPDSDERRLLQAMQNVRYSIFAVEAKTPNLGVQVRDQLNGDSLFLTDIGLGQSASPGLILASNVISLPELSMTTGGMLPVPKAILPEILELVRLRFNLLDGEGTLQLAPIERSELAAAVVSICLLRGTSSQLKTRDVTKPRRRPRPPLLHPKTKRRK